MNDLELCTTSFPLSLIGPCNHKEIIVANGDNGIWHETGQMVASESHPVRNKCPFQLSEPCPSMVGATCAPANSRKVMGTSMRDLNKMRLTPRKGQLLGTQVSSTAQRRDDL